jgi:hypothetical protein
MVFGVFALGGFLVLSLPLHQDQKADATKAKLEELAASRWEGTIEWSEKRSTKNRTAVVGYTSKVSFTFAADGTCSFGKSRPCTWEKKDKTVNITVPKTKKECQASASLTLNGDAMTGSWNHYGGFTCFPLTPARVIKLKRHE